MPYCLIESELICRQLWYAFDCFFAFRDIFWIMNFKWLKFINFSNYINIILYTGVRLNIILLHTGARSKFFDIPRHFVKYFENRYRFLKPKNIQRGPDNMKSGPVNIKRGPDNIKRGPTIWKGGRQM